MYPIESGLAIRRTIVTRILRLHWSIRPVPWFLFCILSSIIVPILFTIKVFCLCISAAYMDTGPVLSGEDRIPSLDDY